MCTMKRVQFKYYQRENGQFWGICVDDQNNVDHRFCAERPSLEELKAALREQIKHRIFLQQNAGKYDFIEIAGTHEEGGR